MKTQKQNQCACAKKTHANKPNKPCSAVTNFYSHQKEISQYPKTIKIKKMKIKKQKSNRKTPSKEIQRRHIKQKDELFSKAKDYDTQEKTEQN